MSNIGHPDLLTHLPTKFLARRSDIIVSSTLSITLTPQDGFVYTPVELANISEEDTQEWVRKRHIFRSKSIQTARLPDDQSDSEALSTASFTSDTDGDEMESIKASPNNSGSEWQS